MVVVTRRRVVVAAAALVAVLLAAAAGRWTAPTRIETREKLREVTKVIASTQQTAELAELRRQVREQAKRSNVVKIRTVVRAPDGTITSNTRVEDKSTTDTRATDQVDTKKSEATTTVTVREVTRIEERLRLVERPPPDWSASVLAGGAVPALWGAEPLSYAPALPRALVLGATLERRVAGPISAGVWATSRLDAGVALRLTW